MLYAITVVDRRVRLHTVGSVPEDEIRMSRFLLRRLARSQPRSGDERLLDYRGTELESSLLGSAAAELGDGPVIVIPPGRSRLCRGRSCPRCMTGP